MSERDIRQNARLMIRGLDSLEAHTPNTPVNLAAAQAAAGLSEAETKAALGYCQQRQYVHASNVGYWLSEAGHIKLEQYQRESMDLSLGAEKVLALVIRQEQASDGDIAYGRKIWEALGIELKEYRALALELSDNGLLDNVMKAREADFLGVSSTPKGRIAFRQGFRLPVPSQDPNVSIGQVGAIVGGMSGGTLQAVGMAAGSQVSQGMADPEQLRRRVDEIGREIADLVRAELADSGQLDDYLEALEELKQEILSSQPRPGIIRKLTGVLSLTGDIGGTIELILLVGPYLQSLLSLVSGS